MTRKFLKLGDTIISKRKLISKFYLNISIPLILVNNASGYMVGNNPYHIRHTLDSEGRYQLEWLVDLNQKWITFHVTAETTGYVGFGLSSHGKMTGADMVIGGVDSKGRSYFADYHAVGHNIPVRDPSQDWELLSAHENGTHTMISFSRVFDTCDPQDYAITEDRIAIIWAIGVTDELHYHQDNRGVFQVHLLHGDHSPQIITDSITGAQRVLDEFGKVDNSVKVWTINRELAVPPQDTLYWCTMHKAPRLPRKTMGKGHMIGFNVRYLNEGSRIYLHHLIIFHCIPPRGGPSPKSFFEQGVGSEGEQCLVPDGSDRGNMNIEYCTEFTYLWAVGGRSYFQPPHVGLPLESEGYYVFQVHLNNPTFVENQRVKFAVDIFYTEKLRQHEGGWFSVRHEFPGLPPSLLVPPDTTNHQIRGMCGSQCTRNIIPPEGVSGFGVLLHTHTAGHKARLRHFRNNRELPFIVADENYWSNYQQNRNLPRELRILPGDQFIAECVFESTHVNGSVVGGFATSQEMCATHMLHYEKLIDIQLCDSQIVSPAARKYFLAEVENVTWSNDAVEFLVDPPHPLAGMPITRVSDNYVDWTSRRRKALYNLHQHYPHMNRCTPERWTLPPGVTPDMVPTHEVFYPYDAKPYQPDVSCTPASKTRSD